MRLVDATKEIRCRELLLNRYKQEYIEGSLSEEDFMYYAKILLNGIEAFKCADTEIDIYGLGSELRLLSEDINDFRIMEVFYKYLSGFNPKH